ncbi:MarR family transcriptional regulator [Cryobacterium sp. CG_9.6]|uniref:MarR family winged helix-turn-helix transcriptional regulator n=1 Tax=Cryobacterium sp. CG_9.6 TaxID=2760710 RepID=UPI0024759F05|nr:MarR family transcriptional regulator [Cryobacterium sp. CG_9.6]MDH6237992.1 DNA-binding MarR family transcriptional regulator [Cryobacterium sp. CG_9.6]
MPAPRPRPELVTDVSLQPRVNDPHQHLADYSTMDDAEIAQVTRVLLGIRHWRDSEQSLSVQSRSLMQLNETDMRALRFLVVSQKHDVTVTPGALAEHLTISTASTTKLLDRLAAGGHIERSPHPSDRRALMITVTKRTHKQVRETIGRNHAQRFDAVARLTPAEREVVIRFLNDLSTLKPSTLKPSTLRPNMPGPTVQR